MVKESENVSPTYLFLQSQNLESFEVRQVLSSFTLSSLLGPAALSPFGVDVFLLPQLLHGSSTGSTRQFGDDERSEGSVGESEGMTRDNLVFLTRRTINQNL